MLHDLWFRLRTLGRRRSAEDDLDDELRFHLERAVDKHLERGLSPAEARRRAQLAFGQVDVVKDDCRDAWGLRQVDMLAQDVRHAVRRAHRAPGFTAVIVITLALGIGATTAVFSVVDAVLLRPLPYGEPDRLVALWPQQSMSNAQLIYLRERARVLAEIASVAGWTVALTETTNPTQLTAEKVSANVFDTLRARPVIGRTFAPIEGTPGRDKVVVVSYALWQGRFGGDPDVIDRVMVIDAEPHAVVGVMPAGFQIFRATTDVWMPLALDPDAWYHGSGVSQLIARLEPGLAVEAAEREFDSLMAGLRREFARPDDYGRDAVVMPLDDAIVGDIAPTLLVLQGTALFILLIAAANVAHLLLVQAVGRGREMAIRGAVGGGVRRVLRQLMVENALLFAAGGVLGVAAAWWAMHGFIGLLPADLPRAGDITMSLRVVLAGIVTSITVGLVVGLVPGLVTLSGDAAALLRPSAGERGAPHSAARRQILVATEVALAVVLLVGAGLMLQTMWRLGRVDLGFRASRVLTLRLHNVGPSAGAAARNRTYYTEVFARIAEVPGVEAVGAVQHLPLSGIQWGADLEIEGRPLPPGATPPSVAWRLAAHDYFRAMGIPLVEGRLFSDVDDRPGSPDVVLVNAALARRLEEGAGAIGRRIRAGSATDGRWATVVGVVGDVRHVGVRSEPPLEIYRPYQQQSSMQAMMLAVRTGPDPASLAPAIRQAVWSVDRNAPISNVRPMRDLVATSVAEPRVVTVLLITFAAVGLVLSVIGIAAVAAYGVRQRRREIGVRLAIGATPRAVVRMVAAEHIRPAVAGAALGLAGAFLLARTMESLVYGISTHDPVTFLGFAGVALMAVASAAYGCARRAAGIDPFEALREE